MIDPPPERSRKQSDCEAAPSIPVEQPQSVSDAQLNGPIERSSGVTSQRSQQKSGGASSVSLASDQRLTGIEIKNYRGYRGTFRLDLSKGENLIVYGENGAGKSSLYHTLKTFLEAPDVQVSTVTGAGQKTKRALVLDDHQHRFTTDRPAIKLKFGGRAYEWTDSKNDTREQSVRFLNQAKGFLDYKALLEIHHVRNQEEIDLFSLVINELLPYYTYPHRGGNVTLQAGWRGVRQKIRVRWRSTRAETEFVTDLAAFNDALSMTVVELGKRASEMLGQFDDGFAVDFSYAKASFTRKPKQISAPRIVVRPAFRKLQFPDYHNFFNEAKLSALAMCLFFAALKDSPATGLRILALDDVLIGLDMANRVKILDLIHQHFANWQILIFTYSKAWFERLKEGVKTLDWAASWISVVLWEEWHDEEPSPRIIVEGSGDLLEMAQRHLRSKDYAAAAVYARKALEALCHGACAKAKLPVLHVEQTKERKLEHLLAALRPRLEQLIDNDRRAKVLEIFARLDQAREFVLNRNAHFDVEDEDTLSAEVGAAIEVVKELSEFLKSQQWVKTNFRSVQISTSRDHLNSQLAAARHLLARGAVPECQSALRAAHGLFWERFGEEHGVLVPLGAKITTPKIWEAAKKQGKLSEQIEGRLTEAKGYLFGCVKASEFVAAKFVEAVELLEEVIGPPLAQRAEDNA